MWPGYHMFFRKQCRHLVTEWTLGLMNAQKYHWCETNLFLSQAVLKHVVSKDFIFKNSEAVQGTGSVSSQEWRNLWHWSISKIFHVMLHWLLLKKKISICGSQVGHMWVTSGLLCGSVGQMGQQVWPTFNPVVDCPCFAGQVTFWERYIFIYLRHKHYGWI